LIEYEPLPIPIVQPINIYVCRHLISPCVGYIVFGRKVRINVDKEARLKIEKENQLKKRFENDTFRDVMVRNTSFTLSNM